MTLWLICLASLRQHALSTVITALSIALAGGLLMSVWIVKEQSQATFTGVNGGFDAVLGARGSKLQLVLNSIFHLEASPGNVPCARLSGHQEQSRCRPGHPHRRGRQLSRLPAGGNDPGIVREGGVRARKTLQAGAGRQFLRPRAAGSGGRQFCRAKIGLKVGRHVSSLSRPDFQREKTNTPKRTSWSGVLKPSNTPADRVIWIPLEGIQKMPGHDPESGDRCQRRSGEIKGRGAWSVFSWTAVQQARQPPDLRLADRSNHGGFVQQDQLV